MGHQGHLPELEDDNSGSGIAISLMESTLRRRSISPSPTPSHRFDVTADVEPINMEEQICTVPFLFDTAQSSFSSEWSGRRMSEESVGARKASLDDVKMLSLPRHASKQRPILEDEPMDSMFRFGASDDDVIAEDGKLAYESLYLHHILSNFACNSTYVVYRLIVQYQLSLLLR